MGGRVSKNLSIKRGRVGIRTVFPNPQPLATVFRAVVFFPAAEVLFHAVAVLCALLRTGDHVPFLNGTSAVVEVDVDRAHIE